MNSFHLLILIGFVGSQASATSRWKANSVNFTLSNRRSTPETQVIIIEAVSSRAVVTGEFSISFAGNPFFSCVSWYASATSVRDIIISAYESAFGVRVSNFIVDHSATSTQLHLRLSFNSQEAANASSIQISTTECTSIETWAYWTDAAQWTSERVPLFSEDVILDAPNSKARLDKDTTIANLYLRDGSLELASSDCPHTWIPTTSRTACLKAFSEPMSWHDAETSCQQEASIIDNAHSSHLALIEDENANWLTGLLCATATLSKEACWIGLIQTDEMYKWVDTASIETDARFRAWSRDEPTSISQQYRGCGAIIDRGHDPEAQNPTGSSWRAFDCLEQRPYVCTVRATTNSFELTVSNNLYLDGGEISGAGVLSTRDTSVLSNSSIASGATLRIQSQGDISQSVFLTGRDAGIVRIDDGATLTLLDHARLFDYSSTSTLHLSISANLILDTASRVDFALRSNAGAHIDVSALQSSPAIIAGGGSLAGASLTLSGALQLEKLSLSLSTPTVDILVTSSDAPVIGIDDSTKIAHLSGVSSQDFTDWWYTSSTSRIDAPQGAFKLTFDGETIADCLPWHASAEAVQNALESLSTIKALGGISVVRYGDASAPWQFGYRYEFVYDSMQATTTATGSLSVHCVGSADSSCCSNPLSLQSQTPTGKCLFGSPSFSANSVGWGSGEALCLADVSAFVTRIVNGGAASILGTTGSLRASTGWHLWPSGSYDIARVEIYGGRVFLAGSFTLTGDLELYNGTLTLGAGGRKGNILSRIRWGSSPLSSDLEAAPAFTDAIAGNVMLYGGELQIANLGSTASQLTAQSVTAGGNAKLRGYGDLIASSIFASSGYFGVLDEARLIINTSATGNLSHSVYLSTGGALVILGELESSGDVSVNSLDEIDHICAYFCGDLPSQLLISGTVRVYNELRVHVNVISNGFLELDVSASIFLSGSASDFTSGSLLFGAGSVLTLISGGLNLKNSTNINGRKGTFRVEDGLTYLPDSFVEPHLEIRGGVAAFKGSSLSLGSVSISNGTLRVESIAANLTMNETLVLARGGILEWPLYDSLTATHSGRRSDARGQAWCVGTFNSTDGFLKGNVDFHLLSHATLADGLSLDQAAYLVNHDIVLFHRGLRGFTNNFARFENRGTFQMEDSSSYAAYELFYAPSSFADHRSNDDRQHQYQWEDSSHLAFSFMPADNDRGST